MSNNTDALVEALADGEYEYVPVEELHEHPKNEEVYGEIDPGESFVNDIRRNGVETPLIVNDHEDTEAEWGLPNTVIGGHRRLEAARRVGLNAVPVRWKSYPEPLATRRLILNNHQRTKNDAQLAREMLMLEGTTRETSQNRLEEAGGNKRLRANSHEGVESVRWDKEIADELGVGMKKVRYTTDVFRFADPDEHVHDDLQNPEKYDVDEEVRELARKKVEQIEVGEESAHSAYQDIKDLKNEIETKEKLSKITQNIESSDDAPAFDVSRREWWELPRSGGEPHLLYCGDTAKEQFASSVTDAGVEFVFADPPYNAGAAEWDCGFEWGHDYLSDAADVVAVTPGIESIKPFMRRTTMPYEWSVSAWIDNGMTRGALGFGNWIYIALFTELDSIHRESQDVARVSVRTSESGETDHKGRKPSELIEWLLDRFVTDSGVVVDPFLGSGTVLLTAAEFTDSRVICGEIKPEFCSEILQRWQEYSGNAPEVVR